jgi:hypothetical protein
MFSAFQPGLLHTLGVPMPPGFLSIVVLLLAAATPAESPVGAGLVLAASVSLEPSFRVFDDADFICRLPRLEGDNTTASG